MWAGHHGPSLMGQDKERQRQNLFSVSLEPLEGPERIDADSGYNNLFAAEWGQGQKDRMRQAFIPSVAS